ncbi:hypothetical protein DPV78_007081 [Talaromyces pinophilus]|nr:hypothetical protein DPV78_007081 [Talaromyces pinophilus]
MASKTPTTKTDSPSHLQFDEKWLRISVFILRTKYTDPTNLQDLEKFKTFLSDRVKPNWAGLIGWYGWRIEDFGSPTSTWMPMEGDITYSMILRFSADKVKGISRKDVSEIAEHGFHKHACSEVKVVEYGDASVDMLVGLEGSSTKEPKRERKMAFGMLPPELSWFYHTGRCSCG